MPAEPGEPVREPDAPLALPTIGVGATLSGRYRLDAQLGSGGVATVYQAHDLVLARDVAVKVLQPRFATDEATRTRLRQEALAVARLDAPGVVSVLDAGEHDGGFYIVMQLVRGPSLDERLAAVGRLSAPETARLGARLARALDRAHQSGLVHRDVKPANVLLDDVHGPLLTDFGIAKAMQAGVDLTADGTVMGTASYLAPEQATGEGVDARSDVYALGCVLFECLTGERPFSGDTPVQVASARIGAHVRPSDRDANVPAVLDAVVATALEPEPDDRYPTALAFAEALEDAAAQLARPAAAAPVAARPHEPTRPLPSAAPQSRTARRPARPATPPPSRRRTGRTRDRLLSAVVIVGVIGLVAVAAVTLLATETPSAIPEAPTTPAGDEAPPVEVFQLTSFDPQGGGSERESLIPNLTDGDPGTAWQTEGYNSPAFGNLKDGVGVLVDLGGSRSVEAVRLHGVSPGVSVELRAAAAAPTALDQTQLLDSGIATGEGLQLDAGGVEAGALVIWLTGELPPDGSRFRGRIGELEVVVRS